MNTKGRKRESEKVGNRSKARRKIIKIKNASVGY
jgi:hypothetical protein